MLEQLFLQHWKTDMQIPLTERTKILLGISGGKDSVALFHLVRQLPVSLEVLHMNFQLRGEESERDANFVRSLCVQYNTPCLINAVDTFSTQAVQGGSIQEVARTLRYNWFEEVRNTQLDLYEQVWIATAHQRDDMIETMLFHFLRGTGVQGLTGIPLKTSYVCRPLHFASSQEIIQYLHEKQLTWVEDSSNAKSDYTRNQIRNLLAPVLTEIQPDWRMNLTNSMQRFQDVAEIYKDAFERFQRKFIIKEGDVVKVPVRGLKKQKGWRSYLWLMIQSYSFTSKQLDDCAHLLDAISGKWVASATHKILKNRDYLLIVPIASTEAEYFIVDEPHAEQVQTSSGKLSFKLYEQCGAIHALNDEAWIPYHEIAFPLKIRRWKVADYFYPLGLGKKKKLSRFFIDIKLSIPEKEHQWIVEDAQHRIVWIVGKRLDHRFRVKQLDVPLLQIKWEPK
ncbi:MAG: tRNA lysidine(34) synthetase TilS [Hydrotalea sp.]|nr:tRNA lysidine(34) synthetase TilS [Hydrotalea sp.]